MQVGGGVVHTKEGSGKKCAESGSVRGKKERRLKRKRHGHEKKGRDSK